MNDSHEQLGPDRSVDGVLVVVLGRVRGSLVHGQEVYVGPGPRLLAWKSRPILCLRITSVANGEKLSSHIRARKS